MCWIAVRSSGVSAFVPLACQFGIDSRLDPAADDRTGRRPARIGAGRPVNGDRHRQAEVPRRGVACPGTEPPRARRRRVARRWSRLVPRRVVTSAGALLVAPRRDNVRFGAAVYGSFLVASVVGVCFEAGQDARFMTTTAFASALVIWLAHWWSEVIGEQISAGEELRRRDVLVVAVASGRWSKRQSFLRPSSRSPGPACGRVRRAPSSRSEQPSSRSPGWALVAGRRADGHGCTPGSLPRSMERSAPSCSCCSRSWY